MKIKLAIIILGATLFISPAYAIKVGDIEKGLEESKKIESAVRYLDCLRNEIKPISRVELPSAQMQGGYLYVTTNGCACGEGCQAILSDTKILETITDLIAHLKWQKEVLQVKE